MNVDAVSVPVCGVRHRVRRVVFCAAVQAQENKVQARREFYGWCCSRDDCGGVLRSFLLQRSLTRGAVGRDHGS